MILFILRDFKGFFLRIHSKNYQNFMMLSPKSYSPAKHIVICSFCPNIRKKERKNINMFIQILDVCYYCIPKPYVKISNVIYKQTQVERPYLEKIYDLLKYILTLFK